MTPPLITKVLVPSFNMNGGCVGPDNEATNQGGGVFATNHSTFNMTNNAAIKNNLAGRIGPSPSAGRGGGVYHLQCGIFFLIQEKTY